MHYYGLAIARVSTLFKCEMQRFILLFLFLEIMTEQTILEMLLQSLEAQKCMEVGMR